MNSTTTETKITTCQICARAIKAKSGTIAHHGYSRPGYGWQTRSCYGTHFKPYEESRDAIQGAIESADSYIKSEQKNIFNMISNAPATITRIARSSYDQDETFEKPADFDPNKIISGEVYLYHSDFYAREWHKQVREMQRGIEDAKASIKFLQQRFDSWKPAS